LAAKVIIGIQTSAARAEQLPCLSFFYCGIQFVRRKSNAAARRLLMTSIFYLPLLFALIVVFVR